MMGTFIGSPRRSMFSHLSIMIVIPNPTMKLLNLIARLKLKNCVAIGLASALAFPSSSFAYSCSGALAYLGLDGGGTVYVVVGNTPLHGICNIQTQGNYSMSPTVCKAAYASLLIARTAGKSMAIYYGDNGLSCTTFTPWNAVPSAYFVEGPQ